MLSISPLELIAVFGIAIPALILFWIRDPRWRWFASLAACIGVAAVLTPADIVSTLILSVVLFATFLAGRRSAVAFRTSCE
ncbi:MAG: hypothetical protein ACR2NZ_20650 [Rubripirellula sp.]